MTISYLIFLSSGAVVSMKADSVIEDNGQLRFYDEENKVIGKFQLTGICGWSKYAPPPETAAGGQRPPIPIMPFGKMQ